MTKRTTSEWKQQLNEEHDELRKKKKKKKNYLGKLSKVCV
jgi:hypothetical protein